MAIYRPPHEVRTRPPAHTPVPTKDRPVATAGGATTTIKRAEKPRIDNWVRGWGNTQYVYIEDDCEEDFVESWMKERAKEPSRKSTSYNRRPPAQERDAFLASSLQTKCSALWDVDEFVEESLIEALKHSTWDHDRDHVDNGASTEQTTPVKKHAPTQEIPNHASSITKLPLRVPKATPNENKNDAKVTTTADSKPVPQYQPSRMSKPQLRPQVVDGQTSHAKTLISISQNHHKDGVNSLTNRAQCVSSYKDSPDKGSLHKGTNDQSEIDRMQNVGGNHTTQKSNKPEQQRHTVLPSVQVVDITPKSHIQLAEERAACIAEKLQEDIMRSQERQAQACRTREERTKIKSARGAEGEIKPQKTVMPQIIAVKIPNPSTKPGVDPSLAVPSPLGRDSAGTPSAVAVEGSRHSSRSSCGSALSTEIMPSDGELEHDPFSSGASSCDSFTTAVKRCKEIKFEEISLQVPRQSDAGVKKRAKPLRVSSLRKKHPVDLRKITSEDLSKADLVSNTGSQRSDQTCASSMRSSTIDAATGPPVHEDLSSKLFRAEAVDLSSLPSLSAAKPQVPIADLLPAADRLSSYHSSACTQSSVEQFHQEVAALRGEHLLPYDESIVMLREGLNILLREKKNMHSLGPPAFRVHHKTPFSRGKDSHSRRLGLLGQATQNTVNAIPGASPHLWPSTRDDQPSSAYRKQQAKHTRSRTLIPVQVTEDEVITNGVNQMNYNNEMFARLARRRNVDASDSPPVPANRSQPTTSYSSILQAPGLPGTSNVQQVIPATSANRTVQAPLISRDLRYNLTGTTAGQPGLRSENLVLDGDRGTKLR